jgi:beta-N-acetylhexosaminidase
MPAVSSSVAESAAPWRAAIVGVAGCSVEADERALLGTHRPRGFILFARNCRTPDQVRALITELRTIVGDPAAPVLIDQEGGRVARLRPPQWPARPAPGVIGRLAATDLDRARQAARLHGRLITADLAALGITVNCAPVLDLGLPGQTGAIGDRAWAADPNVVACLGEEAIAAHLEGGVLPVIKHLPGHGRAHVDSHEALPVVDAAVATLRAEDWRPFRACAEAPFAITAHVLYPALDRRWPATLSVTIVEDVIRGEIGFAGALLSDDLSMGALSGSLGERAARARAAGCDLALHCNGDLGEMAEVLQAAGSLEGAAAERVECALARREAPVAFDAAAGEAELARLLAMIRHPASRPAAVSA